MYELSVIAEFISQNGDMVAKAFWQAQDADEKDHEWAKSAECFKQFKRVTFKDIQGKCDLSAPAWQAQYKLANKVVHQSPEGTFKRLSNLKPTGVIAAGYSNYGISMPGEHSAISLSSITMLYLSIFPFWDGTIYNKAIHDWVQTIRKCYFSAEDSYFGHNKTLRKVRLKRPMHKSFVTNKFTFGNNKRSLKF